MKVSYNWLKEHLPLELSAEQLAERLPQLGFEVASLEKRGPAFAGVVTGLVLSVDKHPNADRLSLCVVDDGTQKLRVVCGAKNVAAGQKIALAREGATLPGGFKIGRSNIRGVESCGMICSSRELGLGEDGEGIWVMDPASPIGQDVAASLGRTDHVLEVELTPNRPDCLSHLGLARELSAFLRIPRPEPAPTPAVPAGAVDCLAIKIEAPAACPRYVGRSFAGLRVGPSPGWLAAKLESVGLRPINNVVDITNYLLLDMGQPLHVFDADRLEGSITVRFARSGERIVALDEKEYPLTDRCLVIADDKKPVAIAGVMGGLHTGVTASTKRAFLESACFDAPTVRRSSQALRLKSDASYRFERGVDPQAAWTAACRASALIAKLCGQETRASELKDCKTSSLESAPIMVTSARINEILGTALPQQDVETSLRSIASGLTVQGDSLRFVPPSYRRDLSTAWDLAEEIARLAGYDSIPYRLTPAAPGAPRHSPFLAAADRTRRRLAALGFCEAYNLDFISDKLAAQARWKGPLVRIKNPLSEDDANLRHCLLPGLLKNARTNLNNGAQTLRLFELGKVYRAEPSGVSESWHAAGLLCGPLPPHWKTPRGRQPDFYDAKGVMEDLMAGIAGLSWLPLEDADSQPLLHPRASLRLVHGQNTLAAVGLLHPAAARAWGLERQEVCLFQVDLDLVAGLKPGLRRFEPFSVFPGSDRDISLLLAAKVRYSEVLGAIREAGVTQLREVTLVDKFTGQSVPTGQQSLTVRLRFGRDDRTMKDEEISEGTERILRELALRNGAVLRS